MPDRSNFPDPPGRAGCVGPRRATDGRGIVLPLCARNEVPALTLRPHRTGRCQRCALRRRRGTCCGNRSRKSSAWPLT